LRDEDECPSLLFLVLSHHTREELHRTIRLRVMGRDLYLCARCTGIAAGLAAYAVVSQQVAPLLLNNPLLLLLLPAPAMIDWVTQTVGLRESNNPIRVATGFLLGACWAGMLDLFLRDWSNALLWLTALVYVAVFLLVLPHRLKGWERRPSAPRKSNQLVAR